MQDCEWKLRSTEQSCKAKVVAAELAKREALDKVTAVETESKRQMQEVSIFLAVCCTNINRTLNKHPAIVDHFDVKCIGRHAYTLPIFLLWCGDIISLKRMPMNVLTTEHGGISVSTSICVFQSHESRTI